MKTKQIKYTLMWSVLFLLFTTVSCKNDMASDVLGDGITVRVNVASSFVEPNQDESESSSAKASTSLKKINTNYLKTQTQVIPIGNGINVVAELVPETTSEPTPLAKKQSVGNLRAASAAVAAQQNLPAGTKYRLLVYDASGQEVHRFDKTVDASGSAFEQFTLDATAETTQYTIVAYSAGTAELPSLPTNTPMNNAVVEFGNQKFMHFVQTVNLTAGVNDLNVVLANKLSEITTVLDGSGIGLNMIKSVGNIVFKAATHNGGSLKLADGTISYAGSAQDKAVTFPAFTATTQVSSNPTVLAHAQTTTATVEIPYIEIAGLGRSEPIKVQNVKIEPGVKYRLILKLAKGNCLLDVAPSSFDFSNSRAGCRIHFFVLFTWYNYSIAQSGCTSVIFPLNLIYDRSWSVPNDGETIGQTFNFPNTATTGVVMNITKLDNSFNMAINDPEDDQNSPAYKIASQPIQFEQGAGMTRNIRFTDGTQHGANGLPNIWDITNGTTQNPVIRVSISDSGVISIAGRKSNNDPTLYPMQLFGGASFNQVHWNKNGNNKITITQIVKGTTYIQGQIAGKRLGACN